MKSIAAIEGVFLASRTLRFANFNDSRLYAANLSGADLSHATFFRAGLTGANLAHANLTQAVLFSADLTVTNLSAANFTGADMRFANLSGANPLGANLSGADMSMNVAYIHPPPHPPAPRISQDQLNWACEDRGHETAARTYDSYLRS
jgi:uncharacterized protein YjbI with pentapeptide repeats